MLKKVDIEKGIRRSMKFAKIREYSMLRRKIDGKYYYCVGGIFSAKSLANNNAKEIRDFGYNVRVIKGIGAGGRGTGYYLYVK